MAELAVATGVPPAAWAREDDATLATVLQVLDEVSRRG